MVTAVRRANPFSYLSGACFVKRETTYIRRGSLDCERVKRVYWVLGVVGSGPTKASARLLGSDHLPITTTVGGPSPNYDDVRRVEGFRLQDRLDRRYEYHSGRVFLTKLALVSEKC
jgi:hypothetical protein